jgi:hypothetical protein
MLSTCPQHAPTKGVCKPSVSQEIIEINVVVIMLRLSPSFFTYAIIQIASSYFASTSLNCKAMAFPKVFVVSKNQQLCDWAPI